MNRALFPEFWGTYPPRRPPALRKSFCPPEDQRGKFPHWRVRGVRRAQMDQIPKFVLNNGGQRGQRGPNGSNSQIRAEQWGGQSQKGQNGSNSQIRAEQWGVRGVRGAKMDHFPKFVLNNGGGQGVRRAEMDQIPKFVLNNGGPIP